MSEITEIAAEVYRISAFLPQANIQFNQFLVRDEEPLANYMPYTSHTEPTLMRLAALKPGTVAAMHGSTFVGDGEQAIRDLSEVMKEVLASPGFGK